MKKHRQGTKPKEVLFLVDVLIITQPVIHIKRGIIR